MFICLLNGHAWKCNKVAMKTFSSHCSTIQLVDSTLRKQSYWWKFCSCASMWCIIHCSLISFIFVIKMWSNAFVRILNLVSFVIIFNWITCWLDYPYNVLWGRTKMKSFELWVFQFFVTFDIDLNTKFGSWKYSYLITHLMPYKKNPKKGQTCNMLCKCWRDCMKTPHFILQICNKTWKENMVALLSKNIMYFINSSFQSRNKQRFKRNEFLKLIHQLTIIWTLKYCGPSMCGMHLYHHGVVRWCQCY